MKAACLLAAILATTGVAAAQDLSCSLAPGWADAGPKRQYTPDNLYDYKDGAAEGYLQYGFVTMRGIDCKSGTDTMSIDVSEMTDPDAAYGIFTANRDPNQAQVKLGMGAQVLSQSAILAKGNYYVEVTQVVANPAADNHAMLQDLTAKIAAQLQGRESTPETLQWFPTENLTSAVLIPESVLGIKLLKRGYVAKYKEGQAFILHEASPQSAAEVLQKLRARFDGAADAKIADEAFQVKAQYLGGLAVFRKGSYIAGYSNLPDPAAAAALATQLATRIP